MTAPTTVIVSRHGQTVWHAENRYAGSSDVDLTPTGRRQAEQLAEWAGRVEPQALYVSPIRRARETAAPVAAALGIEPIVLDDLREVHFGVMEGRTMAEMRSAAPDLVARFVDDPVGGHFPEAEPPTAAAERGRAVFHRIAAAQPGATVLVVAHNTFFRLTLCALLGIPLGSYRRVLPRLDNGTLTTLSLTGDPDSGAALLSFNVPLDTGASGDTRPAAP
ncbi:histidine phosphatase family protein [Nakamurella lactea]|uniref:histidine phosphatase family protein n=1 Tax=Nakamurella lactea TaxID=459515 RepID=UPI0003FD2C83|nr:histidine phosphatase family protein [Nakamurella lactea]